MQQTLKQKIISAITGGTMILGGLAVSDVAIETPTEKLETALAPYNLTLEDIKAETVDLSIKLEDSLAPYNLTLEDVKADTVNNALKLETALTPYDLTLKDITPFTQEKIEVAKESKDFTNDEKAVLEAILKGQGILYFVKGNVNTTDISDVYVGILNKSDLKYDDVKNVTDINKLIRQKYE